MPPSASQRVLDDAEFMDELYGGVAGASAESELVQM